MMAFWAEQYQGHGIIVTASHSAKDILGIKWLVNHKSPSSLEIQTLYQQIIAYRTHYLPKSYLPKSYLPKSYFPENCSPKKQEKHTTLDSLLSLLLFLWSESKVVCFSCFLGEQFSGK